MQYLYKEGNDYVMMDLETYEQLSVSSDKIGDGVKYLKENMNVAILFHGTNIIGIDIPNLIISLSGLLNANSLTYFAIVEKR